MLHTRRLHAKADPQASLSRNVLDFAVPPPMLPLMAGDSRLDNLMQDFGARQGLKVEPDPEGIYAFRFAAGLSFVFQDLGEGEAVIYTVLRPGSSPAPSQAFYETLLEGTFFDSAPAGFAIARDPENGDILAQSIRSLAQLNADDFEEWAAAFLEAATALAERLEGIA